MGLWADLWVDLADQRRSRLIQVRDFVLEMMDLMLTIMDDEFDAKDGEFYPTNEQAASF